MRVYQINTVCGTGSTGRIAVDIANSVIANGGECRIAYGRGTAPEGINAIRISDKLDLYIHALLTRLTDKTATYSLLATKRLIRDIEHFNPDLIQLHNLHGYYLNIKMLFEYLGKCGKPVVWTLHDCWSMTGHCVHFTMNKCEQWKTECINCKQTREYPTCVTKGNAQYNYRLKKNLFCGLDNATIVTPSDWLKTIVEESFLRKYAVKRIYNGVDLENFTPKTTNDVSSKKIVLAVANTWSPSKGLDMVYQIREKLDPNLYEIVVVGLNRDQLKELPAGINGIERLNNVKELTAMYQKADVFFNPSIEETLGMTTVEALACGTPAVVFNSTAVPETVDDHSGIIVNEYDPTQAANAIVDIAEHNRLGDKQECRMACMRRASYFNSKRMSNEYMDLYNSILKGDNIESSIFN